MVTRAELEALHDRLYALEAAVEDVDRDLAATARPTVRDYREAVEWLLSATRPLVEDRPFSGVTLT